MVVVSAHGEMPTHPTGTAPRPRVGANALLPKIVTCAGVAAAGEVPSTWPVDAERLDLPVGERVPGHLGQVRAGGEPAAPPR